MERGRGIGNEKIQNASIVDLRWQRPDSGVKTKHNPGEVQAETPQLK